MGRAPCCDKATVKKGPWSPEEDATLKSYIEENGTGGNWIALPQKIGMYVLMAIANSPCSRYSVIVLEKVAYVCSSTQKFNLLQQIAVEKEEANHMYLGLRRSEEVRQELPPPVAQLPPAKHQARRVLG